MDIRLEGERLDLTLLEFKLLAALAQNRGHVISVIVCLILSGGQILW